MEEVNDEVLSQWGEWIARLSQSDRSVQESVLMQISPPCRAQMLAIPLPPLKREEGRDAAAEQDQQRAAGGLVDVEQPPVPHAVTARESTPPTTARTEKQWWEEWKKAQQSSWERVRFPWTKTILPTVKSWFPSPRTYDYRLETPDTYADKLSRVPLFGSPWPASLWKSLWAWIGAFAGIALVGIFANYVFASDFPTFFAAEGAAATLIYALPDMPAAQPRNMIGGAAISSLFAVVFQKAFASTSLVWLAGALSVATSVAAMHLTGTINPPGGALALLYIVTPSVQQGLGWWYILIAVMNVALLVAVGIIIDNIPRIFKYPTHWL